jgi:hypothetical protein
MSLAAFIGGRATGPRLNKHAPQQDAHDPTQFNQQRTGMTSHPIFGRGGVAMPGMAKARPNDVDARERKSSSPTLARTPAETSRDRSTSPHKNGNRERTVSSPTVSSQDRAFIHSPSSSRTPSSPLKATPSKSYPLRDESHPPAASLALNAGTSSPSHKSPVSTPSLARAIQPVPRTNSPTTQASSVQNVSPAFLKAPVQKDLTPSLSRLQGRGFVQSIVQVSKELQTNSSASGTPERHPVKKLSVLDRWPESKAPVSPTPEPASSQKIRSVKASPIERQLPHSLSEDTPSPTKTSKQTARTEPSDPMIFPQHTPGLGSATTMVIIKPTSETEQESLYEVDELGVRRDSGAGQPFSKRSELPASPGRPLVHVRSFR